MPETNPLCLEHAERITCVETNLKSMDKKLDEIHQKIVGNGLVSNIKEVMGWQKNHDESHNNNKATKRFWMALIIPLVVVQVFQMIIGFIK